jgi:hypothetical protein
MAVRATEPEVRQLADLPFDASVALFIAQANLLVDEELAGTSLSANRLALIETYLAAHFAVLAIEKGSLASTEMGDAKDRMHNVYGKGFYATRFGQQAMMFDTTGKLTEIAGKAELPAMRKAEFRVV